MKQIVPHIWIGDGEEAEQGTNWYVVHAAKTPWHTDMTKSIAVKSTGEERYSARRGKRLAINWVDVLDPTWFRPQELQVAGDFLDEGLRTDHEVLIHCNQGGSRGPALALWYLHQRHGDWKPLAFEAAEAKMRAEYPLYAPKVGVREFVRRVW